MHVNNDDDDELTPSPNTWMNRGARDASASWASEVSSFFFALLTSFFLQLDYMCVNYDSDDDHIPPPVPTSGPGWTEGQQQWQQQQLCFKFRYVLFFVFFCITYNYLQLDYDDGEWPPPSGQWTGDLRCMMRLESLVCFFHLFLFLYFTD